MGRPKLPRKSTFIDMTAMCDVAFLLLAFFILTTKFKPAEAITVEIPNSVASKVAPEKDIVLVTITKDGKVFLTLDDESIKETIATEINTYRNLGLNPQELNTFKKSAFFGSSFSQLKQFLAIPADKLKGDALSGIPCKDSSNNELTEWIRFIVTAYANANAEGSRKKMNLLVKGDNASKYPEFKQVIQAFKKNDQFKFQMITNPESIPPGTELYRKFIAGEKLSED